MKCGLTLSEVYNFDTSMNGIFADLQSLDVPWKKPDIAQSLDVAYLGLHSGRKTVMPFIGKLAENNNNVLSAEHRSTLANMLFNVYGKQWVKQWDTLSLEYNPIENYDMIENEQEENANEENINQSVTNNGSVNVTGGSDTTDTLTQTGTISNERNGNNTAENSGDTDNSVYGFNSSEASPSDSQSQSQTGTQTIKETDTETRDTTDTRTIGETNHSDTTTNGKNTVTGTNTDKRNINRTLTRHGNIGVTTAQQMIESERQLWQWNFFQNVVFPDIDKMLTLAIY